MTDDDRAIRACLDVVAVERMAPGMVRVVTWSDAYVVDARDAGCRCPDKQYHEPPMCKHELAALLADADGLPSPAVVTDDLDARPERVAADGGVAVDHPNKWTVIDHDNDNQRPADSRSEAEDMAATAREFGSENVEIVPPEGDSPDANPGGNADANGSDPVDAVPVDDPAPEADVMDPAASDLPERSVADDPLTWIPGDFVDEIDGSPAINRKGFEVLSHFYDISVYAEIQVAPEDTDHEYCRVKATAITDDGRECEAFGSAHVDRGDDAELLLEMADTRARKRALSIATGVGAVAVAELKNEVER